MTITWKKAAGVPPEGEVLALSEYGSLQLGVLKVEEDGDWVCSSPSLTVSDRNEYLPHVRWYIEIAELLAVLPKEVS